MTKITRAISIKQPFVELILLGKKKQEYRGVRTHHRGRVYLYASMKPKDDPELWRQVRREKGTLPKGLIVGSVEIVDCIRKGRKGFAYQLKNPKRLRRHLKALNQPQPIFWIPRFS